MTDWEKAFLVGLAAAGLYLLYTDPRRNDFCKQLVAGIIHDSTARLT